MLVLTVLQGPEKGRRFELPANEPQQIGRSSEALPLNDQTISRRHAELTPDDGSWYIRDLQSSNGTYVNGNLVANKVVLRPGDQIRTGTTLLLYGNEPQKKATPVRLAGRDEIDISVEHTVESNDDSMIMSVPSPGSEAEFQLKVIYELTSLIGTVSDRQQLLEKVMDVVFDYFDADRGFILLRTNPDKSDEHYDPAVIRTKAAGGKPGDDAKPIAISKTIVRYVIQKGVGVLSANAMNDERFATGDSVQSYGIRSAMCVPIRFKDRIYGVIQVDSMIKNYTYTEDQLALLTTIGVHTGLALANARLYEARLKAERLAAVGQTVASLSHSIKNILQGMRGGAEVVELGMRKNNVKVLRNGWDIVARNQQRIYELAMNMLAYSKQRKPEIVMTNLPQILEEIVVLMQQSYDSKHVALITDFDTDMPPVPLDPGGVHQAVLNLVNNALDACEPETGAVTVKAEYLPEKELVLIQVRDNGIGIPIETQKRLFQPFHSTKGLRGTGLGLVVTKKVVEEHGGQIKIETGEDSGTTFLILLPTNTAHQPHSADTQGPF
ncbi:Sporulation kinase E [Poriferisphaera corsica]|uniref:histidine kinase n=1 Tax=Poriferisphaera corsica TaxID=2528020 RepID=A0A517YXX5_9BACT|nr:ATP-binding protein [Poriferisphaera corsica]QDU35084.1 Sporulation kinase E [Poriferisphaera corsica]